MTRKRMVIILMGPPGAGKGTQAKQVAKKLDLPHISTGDILRNAIKNGSKLGNKAKKYMHKGELVPDEIILDIMKQRLQNSDCANGAVFDGFPRNKLQADKFFNFEYVMNSHTIKAILIELQDKVVVDRLSSRRYCPNCKNVYNLKNNKPKNKIEGDYICDNCGTKLITRDDDKIPTIKNRLQVYKKLTEPMIEFFKDKGYFNIVDGDQDIEKVNNEIMNILE